MLREGKERTVTMECWMEYIRASQPVRPASTGLGRSRRALS